VFLSLLNGPFSTLWITQELSSRVTVKDDVKGTSKEVMMAYFKKQSMAILDVTKKPPQMFRQCG
jgi:hypothetical protein